MADADIVFDVGMRSDGLGRLELGERGLIVLFEIVRAAGLEMLRGLGALCGESFV